MKIFKTLRSKFITGISLFLIFIFLFQALINIKTTESRLIAEVNKEVKTFSQLSGRSFSEAYDRYYPSGFSKFKEIIDHLMELSPNTVRVRLIDMEGKVRFDTKNLVVEEREKLKTISPFLLEKVRKLEPSYIYKNEKKNTLSEIIYPFIDEWGRHVYSLIYSVSYDVAEKEIKKSIIRTLFLTIISAVLTIALINFLIIRVTGPLLEIEKGVRIVGRGNLDYRLKIKTGDELEQLAEEFNKMTQKLKESYQKLEEAKSLLEEKVKERTKELNEKVGELERFHKMAVGRELKMVELKEEIKKLREELEKFKGRKK